MNRQAARNHSNGSPTRIQGGGANTATRVAAGSSPGRMSNGMMVDEDMNMACPNNNSRGNSGTKHMAKETRRGNGY